MKAFHWYQNQFIYFMEFIAIAVRVVSFFFLHISTFCLVWVWFSSFQSIHLLQLAWWDKRRNAKEQREQNAQQFGYAFVAYCGPLRRNYSFDQMKLTVLCGSGARIYNETTSTTTTTTMNNDNDLSVEIVSWIFSSRSVRLRTPTNMKRFRLLIAFFPRHKLFSVK